MRNSRVRRSISTALAVCLAALVANLAPAVAQEATTLSVAEYGLGTGVDDERNLVGRAETFAEGQQVWMWTRLVGGSPGQRIQHVWIREGEEVVSIGLAVGASHWRTWSKKWMHPGSAGSWRVEVRDADGNVLATAEFTCTAE